MQKAVAQTKQEFDAGPRPRLLKPKDISGLSAFKESYIAYSQFSGDAAHPTMMALSRHWHGGQGSEAFFDLIPAPKPGEIDETLHLACIAVIGIIVVVNEMFGYTQAGRKLPELNGRFVALQNEKYGAVTVSERGMEIRTELPAQT